MKILQGDCREKLREMEESSIDAIVTDPPYELEFIGIELNPDYIKMANSRLLAEILK